MEQKQIQIQFKLTDIQQLQFATLTNTWPEGELQVGNQINFTHDSTKREVKCTVSVEFKKNDITQLICSVQSSFEFNVESWSAMYQLDGDQWVLPMGLVHHLADITIGATRGILAVRSQEAGFPRLMLPLMSVQQVIKTNLALKRTINPQND